MIENTVRYLGVDVKARLSGLSEPRSDIERPSDAAFLVGSDTWHTGLFGPFWGGNRNGRFRGAARDSGHSSDSR
jgi:hypothetical protein